MWWPDRSRRCPPVRRPRTTWGGPHAARRSGWPSACCAGSSGFYSRLWQQESAVNGIRFSLPPLHEYVKAAAQQVPTLSRKKVTPHVFRHTTAVSFVPAGVDVTLIRNWLGHAHLDTTNHYAQARLETKTKALEQADPSVRPAKPPRWKQHADLLAWLDSR